MALFLSTYVNKVDRKGRVSVPASFRTALSSQAFQGIVLFRSHTHECLEGLGWDTVEELGARLDHFDFFSAAQDDLATALFGAAVQLPFDGEGRVVLPGDLMDFAGIGEQAAFVGMGRKFQIWQPDALTSRQTQAREAVRKQGLTIPATPHDGQKRGAA